MKKIALFPGSFDPITIGHIDIIERASKLVDELIVLVAINSSKTAFFSEEERVTLIEEAIQHVSNVRVVSSKEELTVDVADRLHAQFLVRGIRNAQDTEYEMAVAQMNRIQNEVIETIVLLSKDEHRSISSSFVREIALFGGDVSSFVPSNVQQALQQTIMKRKKAKNS